MKKLVILVFFFLLIGFVSASLEIGNKSHELSSKFYTTESNISGWVNISLDKESANSLFLDSNSHSIKLIDLLLKGTNSQVDYICSTVNCVSDYVATNEDDEKIFSLNSGQEKIIGIKFSENMNSINSISFDVESDAEENCTNQLEIDFLNDGVVERGNNKSLESFCKREIGCFDDGESLNQINLATSPKKHCQKINLTESPGFKIGAWINPNNDNRIIKIGLYALSGGFIDECNFSLGGGIQGDFFCTIDYLVTENKEYFVCVYAEGTAGANQAKIRGYSDNEGCGVYGEYLDNLVPKAAYDIFAEGKKFDDLGEIVIENDLGDDETLSQLISNYVLATYGSLDCSNINCYVPIKFISNSNQAVTIKNINIKLDVDGLGEVDKNTFFDFTETPAKISSGFEKVFLDEGGFLTGKSLGDENYSLRLNNHLIFEEKLQIVEMSKILRIEPTTAAFGFETEFEVYLDNKENITKYTWNFGENSTETTTENKANHTYEKAGEYNLTVSAYDSLNRSSSQKFVINVTSPEEKIEQTLEELQGNLENVNSQLDEFDFYISERIRKILDLEEAENLLVELKKKFTQATSDEDYYKIIGSLSLIKIPQSVSKSKSANLLTFFPKEANIDSTLVDRITGEDNSENYDALILGWHQRNLNTKISYSEFSAKTGLYSTVVLNFFELDIDEKTTLPENPYLIFSGLDDLDFKTDYGQENESGFSYIELSGSQIIIFSTTEKIDFTNLPVFISPKLSSLDGDSVIEDEKMSPWVWFVLVLVLVLILAGITYYILQVWYKKKYEKHLFPNQNDLYNIINYVTNSRKKGIADKEIIKSLKKSGWNSEQIDFVIKKYKGKRTGMYEFFGKGTNQNAKKQNFQKGDFFRHN